jgi:hypothetical protein
LHRVSTAPQLSAPSGAIVSAYLAHGVRGDERRFRGDRDRDGEARFRDGSGPGLGRGQHRGIFCVSCLTGRLMLRG